MIAWWRIFKFSLLDLVRNASLATMTVIVLSLLLISVNTLLGIRVLTAVAVQSVKEKIDLSIYLKPDTPGDTISKLTADIKALPVVKSVTQISADEALENFKNQYQDRPEIIAALNEVGANPLGPALVVKTDDPTQYSQVITILNKEEYASLIEDKTFADTAVAIDTLHRVTGSIEKALWGVTAVFGFIAIIIIFTTIRVAIYTERIEIAVKKLVGASNWFIRGPYLIEGVILSTISVALALAAIYAAAQAIDPHFSPLLDQSSILTNYLKINILSLAGFEYLAALVLTIGTSAIAMRKYLKT